MLSWCDAEPQHSLPRPISLLVLLCEAKLSGPDRNNLESRIQDWKLDTAQSNVLILGEGSRHESAFDAAGDFID